MLVYQRVKKFERLSGSISSSGGADLDLGMHRTGGSNENGKGCFPNSKALHKGLSKIFELASRQKWPVLGPKTP